MGEASFSADMAAAAASALNIAESTSIQGMVPLEEIDDDAADGSENDGHNKGSTETTSTSGRSIFGIFKKAEVSATSTGQDRVEEGINASQGQTSGGEEFSFTNEAMAAGRARAVSSTDVNASYVGGDGEETPRASQVRETSDEDELQEEG